MNETRVQKESQDARPRANVQARPALASVPAAALLAWLVPGLGHWFLGQRTRAIVFFVTTTVTFWTGVAVGGVKSTVNPGENGWWFAAQLCMGAQSTVAWGAGAHVAKAYPAEQQVKYTAYYSSDNIAVVYTGITGLLNLLIIIDAIARADVLTSGVEARPPPGHGRSS